AYAPDGWSSQFVERVEHLVLPGITAFTREDARRAGERLLVEGPVRIKQALGIGGRGQTVANDSAGLARTLDTLDLGELSRYGVVLEKNLASLTTHSVGQVCVGTLVASYCGTQRAVVNN